MANSPDAAPGPTSTTPPSCRIAATITITTTPPLVLLLSNTFALFAPRKCSLDSRPNTFNKGYPCAVAAYRATECREGWWL
ncbi:hypothetical protein FIBSPDRAFT_1037182 [Athelia psychrophila]|uniref:Uncharacterized protein n=1 Tax=Athelia psychrophila TaxID=1759441 RepID=A0A166UW06_9AGAM|nr:hypothetical protein FIBSPDRAFT_1037182 [Fibularhizoctonia sp. CBS 109695]